MADPQPWERQPGESRQAFEAFSMYRDQAGRRSARLVAEALGKSETLTHRWQGRWNWRDRVAAYDAQVDAEWRAEVARARVDVARKHGRIAALMLQKASQRLVNIDPDKLTPGELERWMRTAAEIERTSLQLDDTADDAIKQAAGAVTDLVKSLRQTG